MTKPQFTGLSCIDLWYHDIALPLAHDLNLLNSESERWITQQHSLTPVGLRIAFLEVYR